MERKEVHKSVVLLSGGVDSIVNCKAAWEEAEGHQHRLLALTFDYGQQSFVNEVLAAKNVCVALGIEHRTIMLPFYYPLLNMIGHAFTDVRRIKRYGDGEDVKDTTHEDVLREAWVPGRNLVLLSIAAAFAEAEEYDQIVIGINAEEGEAFADNRQPFLDAVTAALKFSSRLPIRIRSYTEAMTKEQLLLAGKQIGAPLEYFYSCYLPDGGHLNCGTCQSCMRVKAALKAAGMWDDLKGRFKT
jgi:7-cyano-7-deazaguanine synthase